MEDLTRSDAAARVDLYSSVHKGLRAFMSDTLALVGRTDADDAEELTACLAQVRDLVTVCRVHLDDENRFVHPAIEARSPGSSAAIALEHVHHEQALDALAARVGEASVADRPAPILAQLYRDLARFIAENFEHMQEEETHHNALLWSAYTDRELLEVQHALVASIPPDVMAIFLRWMIPSMSHGERVRMLSGMREGAPPEAFAGVIELARARLGPRDFAKLALALEPSAAA